MTSAEDASVDPTSDASPDASIIDGPAFDASPDAPAFVCNGSGTLDLGFGTNGIVNSVFGLGGQAGASSIVIEPVTSRLLIAGWASHDGGSAFAVVRLMPNGALDQSFGIGGTALVGIPGNDCFINDIALQPDGKIVAVGGVNDLGALRARLGVLRLNPDGTLDATFGVGGLVVSEPAGSSQGTGVDVDAKSRILVSVATWEGSGGLDESWFTTLRYLASGSLDMTFGSGGMAEPAFDNGQDVAYDVLAQPDGRIVVAGAVASLDSTTIPKFGIVRYLDGGQRDESFGTAGLATIDVLGSSAAYGAALDASGQPILVGEAVAQNGAISRLTPLGAPDVTFGQTGIATVPMPPGLLNATVAGNGGILAVGYDGLVRLLASGAVDTSFGANGVVTSGSIHDLMLDVAVQPNTRIVAVGSRLVGSSGVYKSDFWAARYCP